MVLIFFFFCSTLILSPIFSKHLSHSFQILHHFQIYIQKINYIYYLFVKKEMDIYLFICLKKKNNNILLSNIDIKITFKRKRKKKLTFIFFFFLFIYFFKIISFTWFQKYPQKINRNSS